MNHPPIPEFDPRFEQRWDEWSFKLRLVRRHNCCEYERRYESIADPESDMRPIIAAVAAEAWLKEARRYVALEDVLMNCTRLFDHHADRYPYGKLQGVKMEAYAECQRLQKVAAMNARAWRIWGGWELQERRKP